MEKQVDQRDMHFELVNVGLRAQATAAGFVQLCKELRQAGALEDAAIERIKTTVADEVALTCPRSIPRTQFRSDVCRRLDELFSGDEKVGDAEKLRFAATGER
ncbi:hypothetical protein [Croceibacterium ferulae]|uniref:hypothetical protein n=1 Tax=Croceibacterium ferulae TaxID=1854641 RepID=UPI001F4EAB9D|nr:hypothetical protein [Croceibacterium ferulae]